MDDHLSTTADPQTGTSPLWLQKINVDIIFSIASWLDPLSILSLSGTCKSLNAAIGNDRHIWLLALKHTGIQHCIAPHSFENLSISDLKLFSTRPARLIRYISDPETSIRLKITKCILNFGPQLASPSSHDAWPTSSLEYLTAEILPGGRWIISGMVDYVSQATCLCCWDRSSFCSEDTPLEPVATFWWPNLRPQTRSGWFQAQIGDNNSVVLACSMYDWER
ncbi:hypothetical protein DL93DRAFT_783433 [Clavulina sp. PMI_390]|nr:hypothetical protein DL93DRAFT_783433 [Clavulina sp. PMI_390]